MRGALLQAGILWRNGTATDRYLVQPLKGDMALVCNGAGVPWCRLAASGGLLMAPKRLAAGVNFKWSAVIVSASVVA